MVIILEEDNDALIVSAITAACFFVCLICALCHRKRKFSHQRQFTLNRNIAQFEPNSENHFMRDIIANSLPIPNPKLIPGINSSRRQLQGGGSSSATGSNHNLPSIPPPPPHICVTSPSRVSNHKLISVGEVGSLFINGSVEGDETCSDDDVEELDCHRMGDQIGDLL